MMPRPMKPIFMDVSLCWLRSGGRHVLAESGSLEKPRPRITLAPADAFALAKHQSRPRLQMDHPFQNQPVAPVRRQHVARLHPQQSGQDRHASGRQCACQITRHQAQRPGQDVAEHQIIRPGFPHRRRTPAVGEDRPHQPSRHH